MIATIFNSTSLPLLQFFVPSRFKNVLLSDFKFFLLDKNFWTRASLASAPGATPSPLSFPRNNFLLCNSSNFTHGRGIEAWPRDLLPFRIDKLVFFSSLSHFRSPNRSALISELVFKSSSSSSSSSSRESCWRHRQRRGRISERKKAFDSSQTHFFLLGVARLQYNKKKTFKKLSAKNFFWKFNIFGTFPLARCYPWLYGDPGTKFAFAQRNFVGRNSCICNFWKIWW